MVHDDEIHFERIGEALAAFAADDTHHGLRRVADR